MSELMISANHQRWLTISADWPSALIIDISTDQRWPQLSALTKLATANKIANGVNGQRWPSAVKNRWSALTMLISADNADQRWQRWSALTEKVAPLTAGTRSSDYLPSFLLRNSKFFQILSLGPGSFLISFLNSSFGMCWLKTLKVIDSRLVCVTRFLRFI